MRTVVRKRPGAGRGGLNLTHSEPLESFLDRYGPARGFREQPIERFDPAALRAWSEDLGEETFVGTSGRVFPVGFRAKTLLRAWLARLADLGVELRSRHTRTGSGAPRPLVPTAPHGEAGLDPARARVLRPHARRVRRP